MLKKAPFKQSIHQSMQFMPYIYHLVTTVGHAICTTTIIYPGSHPINHAIIYNPAIILWIIFFTNNSHSLCYTDCDKRTDEQNYTDKWNRRRKVCMDEWLVGQLDGLVRWTLCLLCMCASGQINSKQNTIACTGIHIYLQTHRQNSRISHSPTG